MHDAATRILWAHLPDLVPLVLTFPGDSWEVRGGYVYLQGTLSHRDWARFIYYGRLVRSLGVQSSPLPASSEGYRVNLKLSSPALPQMCTMRPLVALFPRLHTFNWRGVRLRPRYLSTLVSFLRGASLRSATVDCRTMGSDLEDIVSSAFKSLSQGFQDLEILEVKGLVDGTLLFPALRDFRSLTTFRCVTASIDEAAGRALASLPQLRTCVIKLPERQSFMRTVDRLRFPCLRDFKVIGTEDAYGRFSRVARCPELIDFTLDVWPIADKDGISRLIQNLRAHLSGSPHLTRLQIVTEAGGVYGGSSATLEEDSIVVWPFHIRMLFELKGLRSLDFSPLLAYHLDNELFASISTAWPLLESLSIGAAPRCFHLSPARVTFQALSILASRCPRLTTVALHLDASKGLSGRGAQIPKEHYAELWADGRPVLSPSKVTTLRLQASPIARPREVAKFLSSVFPDLESVVSLGSVHEDTPERRLTRQSRAKKWSEVRQYLIMMRASRLEERERWLRAKASEVQAPPARNESRVLDSGSGVEQGNTQDDRADIPDVDDDLTDCSSCSERAVRGNGP